MEHIAVESFIEFELKTKDVTQKSLCSHVSALNCGASKKKRMSSYDRYPHNADVHTYIHIHTHTQTCV